MPLSRRDFIHATAAAAAATRAAKVTAEAPAAPATPPAPVPPAPDVPPTFQSGDAGVVPPTALSRATPSWYPRNEIERRREFRGVLEILVDERGDVISAAMGKSVHPTYDQKLLEMARTWRFRPATKDGVPVRYLTRIEVRLGPGG